MDRYSRWVTILKVLLPLAALALLSTLFLLSRSDDPEATIPIAEQEALDRIRDQQVTAPFFSGTTQKGDEILVTATSASLALGDKPAAAQNLTAQIKTTDGLTIRMTSDRGMLSQPVDTATFEGNVLIETSTGYFIRTQSLSTQLRSIAATSPGKITGTGPLGDFVAGQMQMDAKNDGADIHMVFKNGVKLVYEPKQQER